MLPELKFLSLREPAVRQPLGDASNGGDPVRRNNTQRVICIVTMVDQSTQTEEMRAVSNPWRIKDVQQTLDSWRSENGSGTSSSSSFEARRTEGNKAAKGRSRKTTGRKSQAKKRDMCMADRTRSWELKGGRRKEKLYSGKDGWQMHFLLPGSDEELVKREQRDWSLPVASNLIGVFSPEETAHNTWFNSYAYDGNDERSAKVRDLERVAVWGK